MLCNCRLGQVPACKCSLVFFQPMIQRPTGLANIHPRHTSSGVRIRRIDSDTCRADPYSTGDPDLFSPTSHPTANTGEPKGPHPTTTTGRCGLQDPLWHLFWGVCWPDLSDAGSSAERTQESTYKREPGPVCSCRACS